MIDDYFCDSCGCRLSNTFRCTNPECSERGIIQVVEDKHILLARQIMEIRCNLEVCNDGFYQG